jgi:hypothetical protein
LRSLFEISAKCFCDDEPTLGIQAYQDNNGRDRKLVDVLNRVTNHLTNNNRDVAQVRRLHGALAEISNPTGFLSVTSLNQLVHSPTFSASESYICALFGNIYPLLEALNP